MRDFRPRPSASRFRKSCAWVWLGTQYCNVFVTSPSVILIGSILPLLQSIYPPVIIEVTFKKKHFWSIQWFIIIFPIKMTIAVPSIPSCPVASGCPVWLKAQHRVHGLRRKVRQAVVEATKEELSEVTIGMDWWDNLQENIGRLCFSLWNILKYRVFLSIFP